MIQTNLAKIKVLQNPGAIFASAIETDALDFSNHQLAQIIINTDAPIDEDEVKITAKTTLTVCTTDGTTDTAIPFVLKDKNGNAEEISKDGKEITIGDGALYVVKIDADIIGKNGLKNIVIKTTAVTSCTINGSIIALLSSPRYSD